MVRRGDGQGARASALAAALLAALLVVLTAGAGRATDHVGTGTATVSITPATIEAGNLTEDVDLALGALTGSATTETAPLASLDLDGVGAMGTGLPGWTATTAGGDEQGDETIAVDVSGVGAILELVGYEVTAGTDSALAALGALSASATAPPLGMSLTLDAQDVSASVDPTGSSSVITIDIAGIEIGLGDLLGDDVLAALPLGTVVELVDRLGLDVPAELKDRLDELDALEATLAEIPTVAAALLAEQDALVGVLADLGLVALPDVSAIEAAIDAVTAAQLALDAAEGALATAEAEITELTASIADLEDTIASLQSALDALSVLAVAQRLLLEAEIDALTADLDALEVDLAAAQAGLPALESAVTDAEADLAAAQAALDLLVGPATAALAPVLTEINTLTGQLEALLDELVVLLDAVDLDQLRLDLLALTEAPLLGLGVVELVLTADADAVSGVAETTCTVAGAELLGTVVPTPTCAVIGDVLDGLADAVEELFRVLHGLPAGGLVPAVAATSFGLVPTGVTGPDGDGRTTATAAVTPLALDIPSLTLIDLADSVGDELAQAIADADLDGLDSLLTVGGLDPVTVPAALGGAVTAFGLALDALPAGDALGGLETLAVAVTVGEMAVDASYLAAASSGGDDSADSDDDADSGGGGSSPGTDDGGASPGDEADPDPGPGAPPETPRASPPDGAGDPPGSRPPLQLPRTGLELVAALAAASAAIAWGSTLLAARRQLLD